MRKDLSFMRSALQEVKGLALSGNMDGAKVKSEALQERIKVFPINEAFIKVKLDRFNRAFRLRAAGSLDAKINPLVEKIFGHYMAKDFEKANKLLTNAFAILEKSG